MQHVSQNYLSPKTGYRNRWIIAYDILKYAQEPSYFTEILYSCNLNNWRAKTLIEKLLNLGLLEQTTHKKQPFYKTTDKGLDYLRQFSKLKRLLEQ